MGEIPGRGTRGAGAGHARPGDRAHARLWPGFLAAAVVAVLAGLGWMYAPMPSIASIEAFITGLGMWGVLAAIGLMILHSFVPFPAELLAMVNGMVWGPVVGTLVTWSGAMLGAFAAFGLARLLGRPFVERMVSERQRARLDEWTVCTGWQVLILARFMPVIAFNLINYAAGLTRVSLFTFAWTTAVGILPMTALMVTMGHQLDKAAWWVWLGGSIALLGLMCLIGRHMARQRRAASDSDPA